MSGLVSDDLAAGFAIINIVIVAVGVWCYAGPVRSRGDAAWIVAWLWTVIEFANGVTHVTFAGLAAGYFPGALTAVALACTAACLALSLWTDSGRRGPGEL